MLPLFLLFTLVPIIELSLLFKAGAAIGGINTIFIVILTGFVGARLARTQGRAILFDLQKKMAQGEMPQDSLIEGFLVFAGGLLLLTPGFITDALGLAMVFPVTRKLMISHFRKVLKNQMGKGNFKFYSSTGASSAGAQGFYWSNQSTFQNDQIHQQQRQTSNTDQAKVYRQDGHDVIDVEAIDIN